MLTIAPGYRVLGKRRAALIGTHASDADRVQEDVPLFVDARHDADVIFSACH